MKCLRDSCDEEADMKIDLNRVQRDYALMRIEYLKFSETCSLKILNELRQQFYLAQEMLLLDLKAKDKFEERKVGCVFDKIYNETKKIITQKIHKSKIQSSCDAPLTRLRRRLSVEKADIVSSPSTPTKKKGGRLAVKPLLDNIDENLPVNSPKKVTRRNSVAKNIPEDERPVTPARRTGRILSNTSLTSDTPQAVESPRAKRAAARRQSLAGSDTETAATTPVKQTRRTRKDSTSSVEGPAVPATPIIQVNDVILEEPETNKISPSPDSENIALNGLRKSPRLKAKKPSDILEKNSAVEETNLNNSKSNKATNRKSAGKINSPRSSSNSETQEKNKSIISETPDKVKVSSQDINKDSTTPRREQVKPVDALSTNEQSFEASIAPIAVKDSKSSNETSLNDSHMNNVLKIDKETDRVEEKIHPTPTDIEKFCQGPPQNIYCNVYIEENSNTDSESKNSDDQCVPVLKDKQSENLLKTSSNSSLLVNENPLMSSQEERKSTSISFAVTGAVKDTTCEPMDIDETLPENISTANVSKENNISINILSKLEPDTFDTSQKTKRKTSLSQSITKELEKSLNENTSESDVINTSQKNKRKSSLSHSMIQDLEKTLHEKTTDAINTSKKTQRKSSLSQSMAQELEKSFNDKTTDAINTSKKTQRKSSLSQSMAQELEKSFNDKTTDAINTSQKKKRKSSSQSITQDLEKTLNENKSTLILSQVKDDSDREISLIKSPKVISDHKDTSAVSKINKIKNISGLSDKETPLKLKNVKSLGMQTSTPVLNGNGKDKKSKKISTESTASSSDEEDEDSEEEDSSEGSGLIDGEAEDAGEDYESGDSQDESERQYEEDNEILEKGETLETDEDDISDNSDYEKDSFVVSSDEEDNELLDGSGDDLGMSDNELTMSAKSKKKYNERKLKEQKKASKEMYKARHGGKIQSSESDSEDEESSKQKKKPIRQRIDSSLLGSEDECVAKGKKKNRMFLDSTRDENTVDTKVGSIAAKEKKNKSVNESNLINEHEITAICDDSMINKEDPLKANIKIEPKTPQKDLEISTVNISIRLPIDEVKVDENMSVSRINETSDPLQNNDNNDEDSASLCSENQEIMDNYDSILKDLNKETKTKYKDQNMSLDLNKKSKKIASNRIMDELNVTQTKRKKNKQQTSNYDNPAKNNDGEVKENDSSDSLDLKLLFSDTENSNSDKDELSEKSSENFIPLRRTEGKTDVRNKSDVKIADNKDDSITVHDTKQTKTSDLDVDEIDGSDNLNESRKKNKKAKKSLLSSSIAMEETPVITNVSIGSEKKKKKKLSVSSEVEDLTPASASKSPAGTPTGYKNVSKASEIMTDVANISATKSESTKKKKKKLSESNVDTPMIEPVKTYLTKVATPGKNETAAEFENESESDGMAKKEKKRKRNSSAAYYSDGGTEVNEDIIISPRETSTLAAGSLKKKRKLSDKEESQVTIDVLPIDEDLLDISNHSTKKSKKSKSTPVKAVTSKETELIGDSAVSVSDEVKKKKHKDTATSDGVTYNSSANTIAHKLLNKHKRKNREVDEGHLHKKSKIVKETTVVSSQVSRLPSEILQQLDDTPIIHTSAAKKTKIVSTSNFIVEETVKRKNKPSQYLEESVYLPHISPKKEKSKALLKKPKVLPFVPTAPISSSGFTTKFQVNVIPRETKFVAQTSNIDNFKNNYLYGKSIKRMGTYDLYKKQRTSKLTKF